MYSLLISLPFKAMTQSISQSPIKISSQFSSEINDVRDLLILENIEYQKVTFSGKELIGKNFILIAKEISKGKVTSMTTLANSIERKPIEDSVFEVRVISKIDDKKNIDMHIHAPDTRARRVFATNEGMSSFYSLRNVAKESKLPIQVGKKFYFMAYILPVPVKGSPGSWSYCNVDDSGEDVANWGSKLGIPHYIVLEMEFF